MGLLWQKVRWRKAIVQGDGFSLAEWQGRSISCKECNVYLFPLPFCNWWFFPVEVLLLGSVIDNSFWAEKKWYWHPFLTCRLHLREGSRWVGHQSLTGDNDFSVIQIGTWAVGFVTAYCYFQRQQHTFLFGALLPLILLFLHILVVLLPLATCILHCQNPNFPYFP